MGKNAFSDEGFEAGKESYKPDGEIVIAKSY
jgi:hypothetical protein